MFSVRKTLTIIPTIAVMLIGLSACSTPEAKPSPDPTNTKTQAQIEAEFLAIAADSCAKAQTENIVEKVGDGSKIIALANQTHIRITAQFILTHLVNLKLFMKWNLAFAARDI